MKRKFGLIDKVKVVKQLGFSFGEHFKIGCVGRILDYDRDNRPYCYQVMRRGGAKQWFKPQELELVTRHVPRGN